MRRPAARPRRGFSLVELCVAMVVLGIMASIALPKLRVSPKIAAESQARRVVQDLEGARTRALGARAAVRLVVDDTSYRFFLDHDRDSTFTESAAEATAYGTGATRVLEPTLAFRRGALPAVPGDTTTWLPGATRRWRLDRRGIPEPFGAAFTLYVGHRTDAGAATALTVTPAGNVRLWTFRNGVWR